MPAALPSPSSSYGVIALGLAFWLFPICVKPHIEKWLFDEVADESEQ